MEGKLSHDVGVGLSAAGYKDKYEEMAEEKVTFMSFEKFHGRIQSVTAGLDQAIRENMHSARKYSTDVKRKIDILEKMGDSSIWNEDPWYQVYLAQQTLIGVYQEAVIPYSALVVRFLNLELDRALSLIKSSASSETEIVKANATKELLQEFLSKIEETTNQSRKYEMELLDRILSNQERQTKRSDVSDTEPVGKFSEFEKKAIKKIDEIRESKRTDDGDDGEGHKKSKGEDEESILKHSTVDWSFLSSLNLFGISDAAVDELKNRVESHLNSGGSINTLVNMSSAWSGDIMMSKSKITEVLEEVVNQFSDGES